jgi:ABC-type amino acid transport system permease subunit
MQCATDKRMTSKIDNQQSAIDNPEEGQALVITLLALLLGVLLVSGFLYFASTSQRATGAAVEQTTRRYSSDAGIERGLWLLQYGGVTNTLTAIGSSLTTQTTINNLTVTIIITRTTPSP